MSSCITTRRRCNRYRGRYTLAESYEKNTHCCDVQLSYPLFFETASKLTYQDDCGCGCKGRNKRMMRSKDRKRSGGCCNNRYR